MSKIDLHKFNQYVEDGWIMRTFHDKLPLIVWNYTQSTQYEQHWDDITLLCRGLVTDTEGNIVAQGFKKFFNHTEIRGKYGCDWKIPFTVYDKIDGSFVNLFFYDGEWRISSRGSFYSDQAEKAREFLKRVEDRLGELSTDCNYMLEVVYPLNRIVCDYGNTEELILIGVRCNGEEIRVEECDQTIFRIPDIFKLDIKKYKDLKKLEELYDGNSEGFVILFENGHRVKFKFEEYVRLHRVITGVSNKDIWRMLSDKGSVDELLVDVPDEMYDWVRQVENDLRGKFLKINSQCVRTFLDEHEEKMSRKDFALRIKNHKFANILFRMFDEKDYSDLIWKLLRPTEYEKLFSI